MATEQAWLDVPPRRRPSIPRRDVVAGAVIGTALCGLLVAMSASMEPPPAPAPPEPLSVSIGVLAASEAPGGGSKARAGKGGKRRGRKDATGGPRASEATQPAEPTPTTSGSSSSSKVPPSSVPSPWSDMPGLPGLGDLGEPAGDTDGEPDGGGTGEGEGSGAGGGTGDGGLGAYRSQLASWLAAHFHVEGSGLGATALRKLRVRAVLELGEDRVVVGYELRETGTPAIDEAARRALEAVKGQPVPAPPPGLGPLQRRINVVLTCRPDTCS